MTKHETFETDLRSHKKRAQEIETEGGRLVEGKNYNGDKIGQRLVQMEVLYIIIIT